MGLVMSDTLLIDPLLDDAMRLLDSLRESPYALDPMGDACGHEVTAPSEWPRFTFWSVAVAADAER